MKSELSALSERDEARLATALEAAESPLLLETAADASRAAKAWRRAPVLAIDTEFVRERTYFARLGLVQISDGQTVWLLDPMAERTLDPLRQLLENEEITKIVHSPSEDLEVLQQSAGALPRPMVDTQLACALLGQPLQLGYHVAVEWLLGVGIEKDQTRSNWCARPLRSEQRRYAALDVCVLPLMWERLQRQLERSDRLDWLSEDCDRLLTDAETTVPPAESWRRIRGNGRLDGQSLAVLARLAAWREREARKRDRPRGFIVPDKVLLDIAAERLSEPAALSELEGLHPRARARYAKVLTNIVDHTLESGEELPTQPTPNAAQRRHLRQLRTATASAAQDLGITPALLASRRDIEQLVFGTAAQRVPDRLRGWRWQFLEEPVQRCLDA